MLGYVTRDLHLALQLSYTQNGDLALRNRRIYMNIWSAYFVVNIARCYILFTVSVKRYNVYEILLNDMFLHCLNKSYAVITL